MTTEDETLRTLHELAAWADASDELSKGEAYFADGKGHSHKLPPPGLSAEARLAWANAHAHLTPRRAAAAPVSLEEAGMSEEEFAKLPASKKLALANETMARRKRA
jgi:hypothetical protein